MHYHTRLGFRGTPSLTQSIIARIIFRNRCAIAACIMCTSRPLVHLHTCKCALRVGIDPGSKLKTLRESITARWRQCRCARDTSRSWSNFHQFILVVVHETRLFHSRNLLEYYLSTWHRTRSRSDRYNRSWKRG